MKTPIVKYFIISLTLLSTLTILTNCNTLRLLEYKSASDKINLKLDITAPQALDFFRGLNRGLEIFYNIYEKYPCTLADVDGVVEDAMEIVGEIKNFHHKNFIGLVIKLVSLSKYLYSTVIGLNSSKQSITSAFLNSLHE